MTKLQQTIYITATEIKIGEKSKILVKTGEFYFQGQKYTIENGIIFGGNTAQFADDNHSTIQ